MTLAGGAFSLAACGGGPSPSQPLPCGNANPDPCICGRPDASAAAAGACAAELACQAAGGTLLNAMYDPATGKTTSYCQLDGGSGSDAAPTVDAGSDGV